eukprot:s4_g6.t1
MRPPSSAVTLAAALRVYYQTSQAVPELQPTTSSSKEAQEGPSKAAQRCAKRCRQRMTGSCVSFRESISLTAQLGIMRFLPCFGRRDGSAGRSLNELPEWLLPRVRSLGLFSPGQGINQVLANEYLEDSGIGSHVEDPAAGPTIVTLSLLQPVQLTLQAAENGRPRHRDARDPEDYVKILLEPLSLLVLEGPSRLNFTHAIRQSKRVPLRDGSVLRREKNFRRVSLTFRGIVSDRRSATRSDFPEGYQTYSVRGASA